MKVWHPVSVVPVLLALHGCAASPGDPDVSRERIGPDGGTISSPDSVLTLAIQPGALEETLEFRIEATDVPPEVFRSAYQVQPNPELRIDATVSYRTPLPEDTSGLAVGAVEAEAYAQGLGEWQPLPVLRVDEAVGLVTGIDTRVSIFYALLDDATPGDDGPVDPDTGDASDTGSTSDTDAPSTSTGPIDDTDGDDTDGDDLGTTGGTDSGTTGSGESSGEPAVSFAETIEPIILGNCGCHLDDEPAGLSMLVDAYANLVNVASTEAAGLDRIEPGSPEDSYLWHKVNGTHRSVGGTGSPMPAPDGGLDAGTLATIEAWILGGAQP